jgi:hypothetical protein
MFVVVLGYMVFAASRTNHEGQTARTVRVPAITEENYPALAKATDVERWKRAINPDYAAVMNCSIDAPKDKKALSFKVIEDVVGEGEAATCGKPVAVQLTLWSDKGAKLFSTQTELALGSREVAAGFDAGLVGMMPKGERTLLLPPHALVRKKESAPHEAIRKMLPQGKLAVVTVKRLK